MKILIIPCLVAAVLLYAFVEPAPVSGGEQDAKQDAQGSDMAAMMEKAKRFTEPGK